MRDRTNLICRTIPSYSYTNKRGKVVNVREHERCYEKKELADEQKQKIKDAQKTIESKKEKSQKIHLDNDFVEGILAEHGYSLDTKIEDIDDVYLRDSLIENILHGKRFNRDYAYILDNVELRVKDHNPNILRVVDALIENTKLKFINITVDTQGGDQKDPNSYGSHTDDILFEFWQYGLDLQDYDGEEVQEAGSRFLHLSALDKDGMGNSYTFSEIVESVNRFLETGRWY